MAYLLVSILHGSVLKLQTFILGKSRVPIATGLQTVLWCLISTFLIYLILNINLYVQRGTVKAKCKLLTKKYCIFLDNNITLVPIVLKSEFNSVHFLEICIYVPMFSILTTH